MLYHQERTDRDGVVHLWKTATGSAVCGRDVSWHANTRNVKACGECVGLLDIDVPVPAVAQEGNR